MPHVVQPPSLPSGGTRPADRRATRTARIGSTAARSLCGRSRCLTRPNPFGSAATHSGPQRWWATPAFAGGAHHRAEWCELVAPRFVEVTSRAHDHARAGRRGVDARWFRVRNGLRLALRAQRTIAWVGSTS